MWLSEYSSRTCSPPLIVQLKSQQARRVPGLHGLRRKSHSNKSDNTDGTRHHARFNHIDVWNSNGTHARTACALLAKIAILLGRLVAGGNARLTATICRRQREEQPHAEALSSRKEILSSIANIDRDKKSTFAHRAIFSCPCFLHLAERQ